jgi:hypothetical protein
MAIKHIIVGNEEERRGRMKIRAYGSKALQ